MSAKIADACVLSQSYGVNVSVSPRSPLKGSRAHVNSLHFLTAGFFKFLSRRWLIHHPLCYFYFFCCTYLKFHHFIIVTGLTTVSLNTNHCITYATCRSRLRMQVDFHRCAVCKLKSDIIKLYGGEKWSVFLYLRNWHAQQYTDYSNVLVSLGLKLTGSWIPNSTHYRTTQLNWKLPISHCPLNFMPCDAQCWVHFM